MALNSKPKQQHQLLGQCIVCTKKIREGEEHIKAFHGGTYYLVCCASCAAKFETDPSHYAAQQRR